MLHSALPSRERGGIPPLTWANGGGSGLPHPLPAPKDLRLKAQGGEGDVTFVCLLYRNAVSECVHSGRTARDATTFGSLTRCPLAICPGCIDASDLALSSFVNLSTKRSSPLSALRFQAQVFRSRKAETRACAASFLAVAGGEVTIFRRRVWQSHHHQRRSVHRVCRPQPGPSGLEPPFDPDSRWPAYRRTVRAVNDPSRRRFAPISLCPPYAEPAE